MITIIFMNLNLYNVYLFYKFQLETLFKKKMLNYFFQKIKFSASNVFGFSKKSNPLPTHGVEEKMILYKR